MTDLTYDNNFACATAGSRREGLLGRVKEALIDGCFGRSWLAPQHPAIAKVKRCARCGLRRRPPSTHHPKRAMAEFARVMTLPAALVSRTGDSRIPVPHVFLGLWCNLLARKRSGG